MKVLKQIVEITWMNLRNVPQRLGSSLVIVIGIAGVVGVLVIAVALRRFRWTALADALLQDPVQQPVLEAQLLEPIRNHLRTTQAERQARAASTKVDFFTVARESGTDNDEDTE